MSVTCECCVLSGRASGSSHSFVLRILTECAVSEIFTKCGLAWLWGLLGYKLMLGLGIVQTFDCNLLTAELWVQFLSLQGL
jgi:hypothetical protein